MKSFVRSIILSLVLIAPVTHVVAANAQESPSTICREAEEADVDNSMDPGCETRVWIFYGVNGFILFGIVALFVVGVIPLIGMAIATKPGNY